MNKIVKIFIGIVVGAAFFVGCYFFFGYVKYDLLSKKHSQSEKGEEKQKHVNKVVGYVPVGISSDRIQHLGLSSEKVSKRDLKKTIRAFGIVEVDETRIAHVQTKFKGWIEKLFVDFIGKPVALDEPLFTVYSPDLYSTQEEFIIALHDCEYEKRGQFAKEISRFGVDLYNAAQRRLELWDVPSHEIDRLKQTRVPKKSLVFRSPIEGIVLDKTAFIGMNVGPKLNIFTIADLSNVWVLADMYERDLSFLRLGQTATLSLLSMPDKKFKGKITFIDYVVEESTRTVKARFEFDNADYLLKPGMYSTIYIEEYVENILSLPEEALIDTGKRKIVFVETKKGYFVPREVELGFRTDEYYEILSGINEDELVVTSAQFLLDSESRIKATRKNVLHVH